jgi:delta(3,5)-delta(2,4)-dienoyl-CoA isomerase
MSSFLLKFSFRKLWREIGDVFRTLGTLGEKDSCRCILLIGNGKSFCAGIDIADPDFGLVDMAENGNDDNESNNGIDVARKYFSFRPKILEMQQCLTAIEECAVPVVAAVHGSCIGGGIDLICCADIRLCTKTAKFSVREARLGLAADVGTLQRLPKIVGHTSRVRELCYTAEDFDGIEACRIGLVSRLVEAEKNLIPLGLKICQKIAMNSPVAVQGTKLSLNYSRDHSVREGLEHIAMHNAVALMTDDLSASFVAFSHKMEPEFQSMMPHAKL